MPDLKAIADLSSALLTPVIGVVTTLILVNQYRLERRRWRLDLFEKRYAVYRATLEFIYSIVREGKSTSAAQADFLTGTRDRGLFFDEEIPALLDEVWKKGIDLEMHQDTYKDMPVGAERTTYVSAAAEIKKGIPELGRRVQESFGPYIRLKEK